MPSRIWIWLAPLVLIFVLAIVLLDSAFPGALTDQNSQMRLVYSIGLLALVGSSVVLGWRNQPVLALQHAVIWGGIFVGILVVYAYRDELGQVAARVGIEVVPSRPVSLATGEVSIRSGVDGHFLVFADVEQVPVQFLVDTGASLVVLTMSDANRLGISADTLSFSLPLNTANGQTFGAQVTLQEISIGDVTVKNVGAAVMADGLDTSLLGMSFLRRLSSYEVNQTELVLRQ